VKSSNWKLGTLAAMALAAAGFASQSHAGTISLSITPSSPTTLPGEAVGVDIVVNGLPSASGGFTLLLDYSDLTFVDFTLGGVWGGAPLDLSAGDDGMGTVSFEVLADFAITEPDLYTAQNSGGSFTVAHINFTGPAVPGSFTVTLRDWAFSNFNGDNDDPAFNLLLGNNNVPEPMTPLLVAMALGGLALTRKSKTA
jgi:hypothetical protein